MFGRRLYVFFPVLNKFSKAPLANKCRLNNFVFSTKSVTIPCRFYSEPVKRLVTVDYEDVKNAINNNNVLLIDVRGPDEIKENGKIPNSINIPVDNVSTILSTMSDAEFQKTFQRPKPTENSEIIFYCKIGKRSGMAQKNAINLGYKNVKNYLGSWNDWQTKMNFKST